MYIYFFLRGEGVGVEVCGGLWWVGMLVLVLGGYCMCGYGEGMNGCFVHACGEGPLYLCVRICLCVWMKFHACVICIYGYMCMRACLAQGLNALSLLNDIPSMLYLLLQYQKKIRLPTSSRKKRYINSQISASHSYIHNDTRNSKHNAL